MGRSDMIRLTEQIVISALHNLENPDLTDQENEELYGNCYRKHGHDYHVQVEIECSINSESGLAFDRLKLHEVLGSFVTEKFNGRFLNQHFDCTSGEALSFYFFGLLQKPIEENLPGTRLVSLHIQETRKNWFSYSVL